AQFQAAVAAARAKIAASAPAEDDPASRGD
ncbi:thiol reductase thioredoxin, partial [Burkholderia multivorans]